MKTQKKGLKGFPESFYLLDDDLLAVHNIQALL